MSGESLFVQAEEPFAGVAGALRHDQHRMCAVLDADKPEEYRFGHMQGKMSGTLVPLHSAKGGIRNSRNPFGKIVAGSEFVKVNGTLRELPYAPPWLMKLIPKDPKKAGEQPFVAEAVAGPPSEAAPVEELAEQAGMDAANEILQKQAEERQLEFEQSIARQRQADIDLGDILQQMAAAESTDTDEGQGYGSTKWEINTKPAPKAAEPKPSIRVKLTGAFGTYRGGYLQVYVTDDLVILVHEQGADVFTPPSSQEGIAISCNGQTYRVYFAGIEFDLPFARCGIQVFIKE